MSVPVSCLLPKFQRFKSGKVCHLKSIYIRKYTSRFPNRHVVVSLSVTAGIHHNRIKKNPLTLSSPCRTFASKRNVKSRTSYYDVLGITPKATRAQIKSAYYKLSKAYHPDRNQENPSASRQFSEISEAYSVLSNVTLRKRYDNGIYNPRDLTHGVKDEPIFRKKEKKTRNTRSEVYNEQGERMYDFDEYFRAHYGEALQREQQEKRRKQRLQQEYENDKEMMKSNLILMVSLGVISIIAGLLIK